VIDPSCSSLERTAPVLIWFEPTLSRGSVNAAYEVPPSAMNSATVAVTLA
jgi:hypothetical protein